MAGFNLSRRELREWMLNMSVEELLRLVTEGTTIWGLACSAMQLMRGWQVTCNELESEGDVALLVLAQDAYKAAEDAFNTASSVAWKECVERGLDWPPEQEEKTDLYTRFAQGL